MNDKPEFDDVLHAWEIHKTVFPLAVRSKIPCKGDQWPKYAEKALQLDDVRRMWNPQRKQRLNYGIICTHCVVIDVDDVELGRKLYGKLPRTEMITRTPNGVHLFYGRPEGLEVGPMVKASILGIEADIRAGKSYVVGPGSLHPSGRVYERIGTWNWVDVPEFDAAWIERPNECSDIVNHQSPRVSNGLSYITKIHAISGQGGHDATFQAACVLAESGMTETEIFAALIEWNRTNAKPPFSKKELLHKAKDAYQRNMRKAMASFALQNNCPDGGCDLGGDMRIRRQEL